MVIVNQQGEIVLVNSQTERLFGHTRDELLGKGIDMLVPEAEIPSHQGPDALFLTGTGLKDPATAESVVGAGRILSAEPTVGSDAVALGW